MTIILCSITGLAIGVAVFMYGYARWARQQWRRCSEDWYRLSQEGVIAGVRAGVHFANEGLDEAEAAARARDQQELLEAARKVDKAAALGISLNGESPSIQKE